MSAERPASPSTRVLVIADEQPVCERLQRLLAGVPGIDMEWMPPAAVVWSAIAEDRHDLVLLHCRGDDDDGARALRSAPPSRRRPPIVALSDGTATEATATELLEAGAQDCLRLDELSRGVLLSVIRYARDRRLQQRALEQSRQRLATLLANLPGMAYRCRHDADWTLLFASEGATALTGYPPEVLTDSNGVAYADLVHPDDCDAVAEQVAAAVTGGQPYALSYRIVDAGGRVRWVWHQGRQVDQEAGGTPLLEGFITDITDRKLAEQALVRQKAELELSNEELQRFAQVASHDLQEPLRMVICYLELIEQRYRDRLDDDGREFLNFATDGAARMSQLINDLLSFSRVQSRGKPFAPTDLERVLAVALRDLQPRIEENGAAVTHDVLPMVMADGAQIGRVLANLLANALKFRADRRPRIHVGAERSGGEWLLSVRDNGIGIDPQSSRDIFVIFHRLHREQSGSGLGLAICKRIVERHNGRIWVESTPGKGSTFFFTLPVSLPDSAEPATPAES